MGRTSTQAKQEWNRKNYTQVKISVKPATASAFKAACAAADASMASVLSCFMDEYSKNVSEKKGYAPDLSTKRQRRAALKSLVRLLERIRDNEEYFRGRIPDNLHASPAYDCAEECIAALNEALDILDSAY